jgi:transposase
VREATKALKANRRELHALVEQIAPGLTARPGIGPVSAAQVVVSFSHPGRVRNDAAFAALACTSPIQASSGQTVRHRLNRGGDRALNRAIHTVALTRMRSCARAHAYVERRTAEGRDPPRDQALHRPRALSDTDCRHDCLTHIEAPEGARCCGGRVGPYRNRSLR